MTTDVDCFFTVLDDDGETLRARANVSAVSPWGPDSLHGGPAAALTAAAMRRHHDPQDRRPARVAVEILRPVPVGVLAVRTRLARPGRKVELVHAELFTEDGQVVMTAAEWRVRQAPQDLGVGVEGDRLPPPDGLERAEGFFRPLGHDGYVQAMDVRFVRGGWSQPGPATAWMRMPHPLLDDEPTDPLSRVLIVADSANGISARVGEGAALHAGSLFINVDLTVHLSRLPEGEWVGMDASTVLTDDGVGLSHSTLHDRSGPIGIGAQALLVDRGVDSRD